MKKDAEHPTSQNEWVEEAIVRAFDESPQLLDGVTPSRDLWAGIESRIEARVLPIDAHTARGSRAVGGANGRSRWMPRWASMGVAAATLVVVTATITYVATEKRNAAKNAGSVATTQTAPNAQITSPGVSPDASLESGVTGASNDPYGDSFHGSPYARPAMGDPSQGVPAVNAINGNGGIEQAYDRDIAVLKATLDNRRGQLDTTTVAVLERNLRIIDEAIRQSREALAKDPNSPMLSGRLNRIMERKVKLLRTAVMLPRSA